MTHRIPDDVWETIIWKLAEDGDKSSDNHLESLTLVSKRFMRITNRLKRNLTISPELISHHHRINKVFRRFPNLNQFKFDHIRTFPRYLSDQLSKLPIKSLHLTHHLPFSQFLNEIIYWPATTCSSITSLTVESSNHILTDDDVAIIGYLFCNLEELNLTTLMSYHDVSSDWAAKAMTDRAISYLSYRLHHLRRINLAGNLLVSDISLISLCENCPDLEEIGLVGCPSVTQQGVNFALYSCKNLKSIRLSGLMNIVESAFLDPLCHAKCLTELHFTNMDITGDLLQAIITADVALKTFCITACRTYFSFTEILPFVKAHQSHLEYVALEGDASFFNDVSMMLLARHLPKVKTVKLYSSKNLSYLTLNAFIRYCPMLHTLEMRVTNIGQTKSAINTVATSRSRIRILNLSENDHLSDPTLMRIALDCPHLEMVDLSFCPAITGQGVGYVLRTCRGLRSMKIQGCEAVRSLVLLDDDRPGELKLKVFDAWGTRLDYKSLLLITKMCPNLRHLCAGNSMEATIVGNIRLNRPRELYVPSWRTALLSDFDLKI